MKTVKGERHKPALFYGWVIVAVMTMAGALSMAMGTFNYGLFIKPMGDELGIGRAAFGWAQTTRQAASALTSPIIGGLIDRFGSRVLLAVAAALTGGALVGLGFITRPWHLIALFTLMGLVGMGGPGTLVISVPVAKWFVRKRGRAMSFMTMGVPLGGVVFVPLTQVFIGAFGWRHTWVILAPISAGVIVLLSLWLVRRQPEDMGLMPDGDDPVNQTATAQGAVNSPLRPQGAAEVSWTSRDAVRTWTFWRLVIVFSLVMLATSSMGLHRIPSFVERGVSPWIAAYAFALEGVGGLMSTFALGILVQRFPARYLGAVEFLILALATFFTIIADSPALVFLSTITFGLGIGGNLFLQTYLWAAYFGRQHLGSIRGIVMPITLVFGGAGAPLAGYVRDATGTYTSIWWAGLGLMLVGAVLLATTPPPGKRPSSRPAAVGT